MHVLVNNAAIEGWCAFEALTDEQWDAQMAVNLKGAFIATQEALPDMQAAGWGRTINISALGGQTGGVMDMTRSLATELGRRGITVNSVSPGCITAQLLGVNGGATF